MDRGAFEEFGKRHGGHGSWAIWTKENEGYPRSNIADVSVLCPDKNPNLLSVIHGKYIAVGLNISGEIKGPPFSNFHSDSPYNRDFIIRYSFRETPAWGCYMTDALKCFPERNSAAVVRYFRNNPQELAKHAKKFTAELNDLAELFPKDAPTLLCFGEATYRIVNSFGVDLRVEKIIRLRHYADYRKNKQDHRREFHERMKWADSSSD